MVESAAEGARLRVRIGRLGHGSSAYLLHVRALADIVIRILSPRIQEVTTHLKTLFYTLVSLLVTILALGAFAVRPAAAEESLLVLTTSDTRGELAPCG
jgi:hypothetical protein